MPQQQNVVSISGGKDSTALLLVALAVGAENLRAVFADTGHEHPATYDYVRYLADATGVPIQWVRADFAGEFDGRRAFIVKHWQRLGIEPARIARALDLLHPTGNPFLDLCLVKGIFPSARARFCTQRLKIEPIYEQVIMPALDDGHTVISWQGVRAEESPARALLPECDTHSERVYNYRPLLRWTWADVFEAHNAMGIKPNPLYAQGMRRVGCMPCIHAGKDELLEIARRFPDEIARVKEWESLVAAVCRRGAATFFPATLPHLSRDNISTETHGIEQAIFWASTGRGGRQLDFFRQVEHTAECSSVYGLCE